MRTDDIPVRGMHCDGCSRTLSLALQRLEGVHDAKADHEAGAVRVRFDESVVSEADIFERIAACGFEVGSKATDASGSRTDQR